MIVSSCAHCMGAKLQIFNEIMAFLFRFYCYLSLITDILPSETPKKREIQLPFEIKYGFWGDSCAQIGNTEPFYSLIWPYNQLLARLLFHARSMNNPLEHVFKPIFLLSLSSIMELTPWRTKVGKKNECAITQHFEVMEHEQSAKSCLKKCKFTVKKCLV